MQKIKILSVNISKRKGTIKHPVNHINITLNGIKNDAHAGSGNRQVSLLGIESIELFSKIAGRKINFGEFAENITTEGLDLLNTQPLDRFICGNVILEVTQIGKKCHGNTCAIFKEVGDCIMPKQGIFCRVIKPGTIKADDIMIFKQKIFKVLIITLSDRASKGEYEDKSGPKIEELIKKFFNTINRNFDISTIIIPDEAEKLKLLILNAKKKKVALIITTGGTGIGKKDITVDTVKPMLDKEIPGIMEIIRIKYGQKNPNALLSRAVAGIIGESIIFTLPGSVRAVEEYLNEVFNVLEHLIYMLHGLDVH